MPSLLDRQPLTAQQLLAAIEQQQEMNISAKVGESLQADFELSQKLITSGQGIYGVTTNLGYGRRFPKTLDQEAQDDFQQQVLGYGQDHGLAQLTPFVERAVLLIRIQTPLSGRSGVSPWIVSALQQCSITDYGCNYLPLDRLAPLI